MAMLVISFLKRAALQGFDTGRHRSHENGGL
jgi:hypothetical protein